MGLDSGDTAIVHDWFQGFHGSERVVDTLLSDVFGGQADVLTFHAAREILPTRLADRIVKESRIAGLPGLRQEGHKPGRWRYLLPWMPMYFRLLDVSRYDLVVSSSHACASAVRPRPDALHVCYCYTPMRYAWLPQLEEGRVTGPRGAVLRLATAPLRRMDVSASRRPHGYIAISEAIRERIHRFYGRDAVVIHPPVETDEIVANREKDPDHFLWVHRLVSYKRPEIIAEAFRGLPYRLTMVGIGPLEQSLRATLPPNVELKGWVSREELYALYEGSSGFLHVGEEDFGITMVEALAAGTPVIALNRGGARDIVRDGVDGRLLDEPTVERIRSAVREIAGRDWDPEALAARAAAFSRRRFVERFEHYVSDLRSGRRARSSTAA
jgi:glycosyltransferase involved in cell wall biosynthesis